MNEVPKALEYLISADSFEPSLKYLQKLCLWRPAAVLAYNFTHFANAQDKQNKTTTAHQILSHQLEDHALAATDFRQVLDVLDFGRACPYNNEAPWDGTEALAVTALEYYTGVLELLLGDVGEYSCIEDFESSALTQLLSGASDEQLGLIESSEGWGCWQSAKKDVLVVVAR